MTTIVSTRRDADGNNTGFVDANTSETLVRMSPVVLDEDFVGAGHSSIPANGSPASGYPWVQRIVKAAGTPTVAVLANSPGGIVAMALDATSEQQEALLYANDQLNWSMLLSATFETRAALSVMPTVLGEVALGLQSAWISGPDNGAYYARFQISASGVVYMQTKDGVNTLSASTGITLAAGAFHNFRIDAGDLTDVQFWIDGVKVSANGQFTFKATGAAAVLQPYCSVYKPSGVGLATLQIDMIILGANRV